MEFIHPYWLFGLLAISVPIIIHLFNFRRFRKYYFTNLKFLKNIKKETRKQHRLRHFLVLLSRILAITFLVMAFARPYIPGPRGMEGSAVRYVAVYLDNSLSMQASVNGHSLLDEARSAAASLVSAYGPSDRFLLITNDFEGKHQGFKNPDEFVKGLKEVTPSPKWRTSGEILERFRELLPAQVESRPQLYFLSDFQKVSFDFLPLLDDTTMVSFLVPLLEEGPPNVYIDSCGLGSPFNNLGGQQSIVAYLRNASSLDLEKIPVRLTINGQQRALASFDIKSGGISEVELPFTNREAGIQKASLEIDDYPVSWDDKMFLSWKARAGIPVLLVSENEPGRWFTRIFTNDSVFNLSEAVTRSLDYSVFGNFDLIVLDHVDRISSGLASELERYMKNGGSLLLIPGPEAELNTLNNFLDRTGSLHLQALDTNRLQVTGLNTDHPLFSEVFESVPENIDLPNIPAHFPIQGYQSPSATVIMDLQNGDPMVIENEYGKGKLHLISSPAGDAHAGLTRHALWVPLVYRIALLSKPAGKLYYTIGLDESISVSDLRIEQERPPMITLPGSEFAFIPGYRKAVNVGEFDLYGQIRQSGNYALVQDDRILGSFAFNYNRNESDPAIYSPDEIREIIAEAEGDIFLLEPGNDPVDRVVSGINQGTELWKLFIWLGIFFIFLEIFLLRLFRK